MKYILIIHALTFLLIGCKTNKVVQKSNWNNIKSKEKIKRTKKKQVYKTIILK